MLTAKQEIITRLLIADREYAKGLTVTELKKKIGEYEKIADMILWHNEVDDVQKEILSNLNRFYSLADENGGIMVMIKDALEALCDIRATVCVVNDREKLYD